MGSTGSNGRHGQQKSAGRGTSVTIPSNHNASRDLQKRILDDVNRHGFDPHSEFAIKLALEEAMINAIKHGNKLDEKKKVHVEFEVTPKKAEIVIEDQGSGFKRK